MIDEKRREHERTALAFREFLKDVKPVENADEEVSKKNPIYQDPIFLEALRKRGIVIK